MQDHRFSNLRAVFFPIHGGELKKFLPLAIIKLLILFNFYILHNTKDAFIVATDKSGAEALNFIKIWGVVPVAFLFFFALTYFSNFLRVRTIFYSVLAFFAVAFVGFAFFVYPISADLHMTPEAIESMMLEYPRLKWFVPLYGYWTFSLFYIVADLWGSMVVAYLFWQFANQITRLDEAPRFYPMFNLIGTVGIFGAGYVGMYYSQSFVEGQSKAEAWGVSLQYLSVYFAVACALIIFIHRWIQKHIMTDPHYYDGYKEEMKKEHKAEAHMSFFQGLKYVFSSPYILMILLMTLGYQISINLMEISWKAQINELQGSTIGYSNFMGKFTIQFAVVNVVITLIATNLVRKTPWLIGAMATPFVMGITGFFFLLALLFPDTISPMLSYMGTSALVFTVWMGSTQSILTKTTKNCLFNATREMVYIPLDQELKIKGKAAVDVIAERLGKSGGAVIQQLLLIFTAGTQKDILPYISVIVVVMMVLWIMSIFNLNKHFMALLKKTDTSLKG